MAIELTDKITPKNNAFADIVDAKNVGGSGTSANALQADSVANNGANKVLRVDSTGSSHIEAVTLTAGTNVTITHGAGTITIDSTGGSSGSGTVTSVTLATSLSGLSVTGTNPITTSGTFTLGGTLGASSGGTGQSSYLTGNILYASTSNALAKLAPNNTTTKTMLTQTGNGGSSNPPQWDSFDAILPTQTGNSGKVLGTNGTTASWVTAGSGSGNVTGPSSSIGNQVAIWGNTTGTLLAASNATLSSTGYLNLGSTGQVDSNYGYFGTNGGLLSAGGGFTISNGTGFTMTGSTSGVITIQPGAAAAGSYTWKLPTSMPTATDYFLKTSGSTGETAWATISGVSVTVNTKKVATDQTYTSSTTLTKITSLDFSAAASKTYFVHGSLAVAQLGSAADFKYAFDIPTGATMSLKVTNLAEGSGVRLSRLVTTISAVESDLTGYNSIHPAALVFVTISGWITTSTTAGTISFYACQNTSSASSTIVYSGSSITYSESN